MDQKDRLRYWRKNLRYLLILLVIWFVSSFVLGILFVDYLDGVQRTPDGVVEDPDSFSMVFVWGDSK